MSFASSFTQLSLPPLPLATMLQGALLLALLVSFLLFFRPLLSGVVRALLLMLRRRPAHPSRTADGVIGSNA